MGDGDAGHCLCLWISLSIGPDFSGKGAEKQNTCLLLCSHTLGPPAQLTPAAQHGCPWGFLWGFRPKAGCGQSPSWLSHCFVSLPINHSPSWSLSGSLSEVSKISCSRRLTMQRAVTAPAGRPGGIGFQFVPLAIGQAKQSSVLQGKATGFAQPLLALAGKNIIIRLQ